MASILILTFLFQVFLIFFQRNKFENLRDAFMRSVIVLAIFVWFSTESLSYFSQLNSASIPTFWILANLAAGGYLNYFYGKFPTSRDFNFKNFISSKKVWFSEPLSIILFFFIAPILITVLITALYFPPNTVDVITYHLPRVAHWIQAGNVEFYPTNIDRQLFNAPFAEFSLLHLQLLSGNDYYANLVQFFSFASIGIVASLIAKKFKLDNFGQIISVFATVTLPIAILQASSAKNDLVVTLFVCSFFYFYLEAAETNSKTNFIFAGLSLGLAILTKGNAYLYCLPIGFLIFAGYLFGRKSLKLKFDFLVKTSLILFLAFLINGSHYYRNWQMFGNPLYAEARLKNEKITIPIIYANAIRNYVTHLAVSSDSVSKNISLATTSMLGNEATNPASTVDGQEFQIAQSFDEDTAGNFYHTILLTFGIFYVLFLSLKKRNNTALICAFSIVGGFLLLCVFLKWNIWISRIHLPLFCLASPLIALLVSKINQRVQYLIVGFLIVGAVSTILFSSQRNFFAPPQKVFENPRTNYYFTKQMMMTQMYFEATNFLKKQNPQEVGLYIAVESNGYSHTDWEYPLWFLMKEDFAKTPKIRHFGVTNASNKLNKNVPMPEFIISTSQNTVVDNVAYKKVFENPTLKILKKIE